MKSYYLLNTNRKLDPEGIDEQTMLAEGIAAAYMTPWKNEIRNINSGDIVFLYRVEEGVIAFGEATSKLCSRNYRKDFRLKNEEFYKKLKNFQIISDCPISAKEINHLTSERVSFQKTLIKVSTDLGEALLNECKKKVALNSKQAA